MKTIFLLGLATVFSLAECEQDGRYTNPSPEMDIYKPVNTPSLMKQKIKKVFGIVDLSNIISDLNKLKTHTKSISKK